MSAEAWGTLARPGTQLRELWAELTADGASLGAMERLGKRHGREMARFVSMQMELGRRASSRFPDGRLTFFTPKGLEQASGAAAADERAARFARASDGGGTPLAWDACCGIGSDAVALARSGLRVVATDLDAESARCTAGNLELGAGVTAAAVVAVADARGAPPVRSDAGTILALFDPDRRRDGVRSLRPDDWAPPLRVAVDQCTRLGGGCVKLAPGLEVEGLGIEDLPGARLSWISVDGEMKELNLWVGSLGAALDGGDRSRIAVRRNRSGDRVEHSGPTGFADEIPHRPPAEGDWLVELDVALWQSDLAPPFAAERGLGALEPGLKGSFLMADARPAEHGMLRAWRVKAHSPAAPKRVRAMLRAHEIGPVTVKTRGIREPADALAARYGAKPGGKGEPSLVAVTPVNGKRTAILLERG